MFKIFFMTPPCSHWVLTHLCWALYVFFIVCATYSFPLLFLCFCFFGDFWCYREGEGVIMVTWLRDVYQYLPVSLRLPIKGRVKGNTTYLSLSVLSSCIRNKSNIFRSYSFLCESVFPSVFLYAGFPLGSGMAESTDPATAFRIDAHQPCVMYSLSSLHVK